MSSSGINTQQSIRKNGLLLLSSMSLTFTVLRVWLYFTPNADFNVGRYNIHHLFTGLVLAAVGGVPLAIFDGPSRRLNLARLIFGVGLGMALDEWVYLIATDGTNASYMLPVSFWGGVVVLSLAGIYAALLTAYGLRRERGAKR